MFFIYSIALHSLFFNMILCYLSAYGCRPPWPARRQGQRPAGRRWRGGSKIPL